MIGGEEVSAQSREQYLDQPADFRFNQDIRPGILKVVQRAKAKN